MLFLFAGYFIHVDNMPVGVQWISWLMPSRYALEGSLNNVFSGQSYYNPAAGVYISGDYLLETVFGHTSRVVSKWANFVIVIAWMLLFRGVHVGLLLFNNRHFGKAPSSGSSPTADMPLQPLAPIPKQNDPVGVSDVDNV